MFKSRKKKQQQKLLAEEAAKQQSASKEAEIETSSKYKLLDDIHLAHDFRSSIILPQLNKDLDPLKLSRQQQHLAQLRDIPESPTTMSPPLSPPPPSSPYTADFDGSKQYQDLAAWKKLKSQNRYSNGLFGGKQRGRPKPNQIKRFRENEQGDLQEIDDEDEDKKYEEEDQAEEEEKMDLPEAQSETDKATTEEKIMTLTPPTAKSIMQQVQNISEDEDDDEELEEEEEDTFLEEEYEPDSDMEENFFFQDFSADANNKNKKTPGGAKKTSRGANGGRRRSTKVMSKFDLSSFAQDLHDHRLSVIQPRESRIIMTEDDELELEKLLERQRQRMSMMTIMTTESTDSLVPPPPMPSLDLIKPHQQRQQQKEQQEKNKVNITPKEPVIAELQQQPQQQQQMPVMNSDHGSTTTTNSISSNFSADEFSTLKKTTSVTEKDTSIVPQEISVVPEFTNTAPPPVPASVTPSPPPPTTTATVKPTQSLSTSSTTSYIASPKIDQLKRSVSTTSIKSNNTSAASIRKRTNLVPIKDVESRQNARKSLSMDNIHVRLDENEPSVTSAALDWINQDSSFNSKISDPTSFVYKQQNHHNITATPAPQQTKSRSLFGSLRQVSRSKTHHASSSSGAGSGIKGLVRNFSSSHKSSSIDRSNRDTNVADAGMSRAAMAVIQHNIVKHEQKKTAPVIPQEDSTTAASEPSSKKEQRRSRTKSDSNNGGRLIAHLLARASSHTRKHNGTKIVNMEKEDNTGAAAKKRAQVVRKTIIYVQPDSLHDLLKNGGEGSSIKIPPLPTTTLPSRPKINTTTTTARNTMASDGSLSPDDETIRSREYVTATKVVRQTSVRKRVETSSNNESNSSSSPLSASDSAGSLSVSRQGSKKRWQLKSVDENELLQQQSSSKHTSSSSSNSTSFNSNNEYLEGVELREMSDGSVVWGIVKKQGNRKSFFAPNHRNEYEHIEDEELEDVQPTPLPNNREQHKHSNSLSPPPIPKRSPRRQVVVPATDKPTTDIYYSNQMTLPNLLKMMQNQQQHPGDDDDYDFEDDVENEEHLNERAMASVDDQLDEMMRMLQQQR